MRTSSASMLVLATLALAACDRPTETRVPSVTPEAIRANAEPPPLAVRTDVNAAEVEAIMKDAKSTPDQPDKNGPDQALFVAAQDAAAKAPDTASADEAKKRVLEAGAEGGGASATASNPQASELTKFEEVARMPKPGQANDHSTDAPEKAGEAQRQ